MSSDGGVVLLRKLDDRMGLTARLVRLLGDDRDEARIRHSRLEQVRQRVYQICMGYEDCNDGDWLRHDPAFRLACDYDLSSARGNLCLSSHTAKPACGHRNSSDTRIFASVANDPG